MRNEPGTLLAALQAFANRSINLSKLESRPSRAAAWEYVFWADLDAHQQQPACAAALDDLRGGIADDAPGVRFVPAGGGLRQGRAARIAPPTDDEPRRDADQRLGPTTTTEG